MKNIDKILLVITVIMTTITSNGQTIKDFFIPETGYNKVSFYTPGLSGERTEMTRTLYYVKDGDLYNLTDAKLFNGQPSSIQTITVEFTNNEVKMVKSTSTTMFETNKKISYNPPRIILKMPSFGNTSKWSFIDIPGDKINCTAKWINIKVNGIDEKALKVIQEIEGFGAKIIEYYVKGVGLWKTKIQGSDGTSQTTDEFDGLDFDPTAK